METISSAELVMLLVFTAGGLLLVALPAGRICARLGFSPWIGALAIVPLANLGLLWYIATSRWPRVDEPGGATDSSSERTGP